MADNLEVVGLEFDTRDFERQIRRAERRLDQLEDSVDSTANAAKRAEGQFGATAAAVVGLVSAYGGFRVIQEAGRFVFDTNREFQVLEQRLVSITGSTTEAARAFAMITEFAKTTPFEVQNLTEAFTILQAAGIEPTAEMLEGIGNFASAMGRDITEAVEAILRAGQGGTERLRESFFIPITTEGEELVINFRGVEQRVAKDAQALVDHFTMIGEQEFGGGMARQMGIIEGALSNLQDTAALTASAMGEDTGLNAELVETIRIVDDLVAASEPMAVALGGALAYVGEQANKVGRHIVAIADGINRIREDTPNVGGSGMGDRSPLYGSATRPGRLPLGPVAPMISDPFSTGPRVDLTIPGAPGEEGRDPAEAARAASRRNRLDIKNRGREFAEAQEAEIRALERRRELVDKNHAADIARYESAQRMVESLQQERLALEEGEEAALRYSLGIQGITGAQQEAIVEEWKKVEALEAQAASTRKLREEELAELEAEFEQVKNAADRMAEAITDAFMEGGEGAFDMWAKVQQAVDGIISELARLAVRRLVTEPLANAFLDALGSGMDAAAGGGDGGGGGGGGGSNANDFGVVSHESLGGGKSVNVFVTQNLNANSFDPQTAAGLLQSQKGVILEMMVEGVQESEGFRRAVGAR